MKYIAIGVKDKVNLEKGTILRFLGQDYKDNILAFEVIGNRVGSRDLHVVEFK